jgi:hypothetical protein
LHAEYKYGGTNLKLPVFRKSPLYFEMEGVVANIESFLSAASRKKRRIKYHGGEKNCYKNQNSFRCFVSTID